MMKKIMMPFTFISVFFIFIVGCTTVGKGELTRIDVFIENRGDTHIQDKDTLALLENLIEQVNWEPIKVPSMAREADVKAVFFYEVEKNMPERLYEYQIRFNEAASTATMISNDEKAGYGELDNANAKTLKDIFFK
jgi:hypothetical protein